MEQWQRRYITKNLPFLLENIHCDTMLRAVLHSEDCLSREDDERLERSGVNLKTTSLLLSIIQIRSKGYQTLARALFKTNQSGALLKLLQGVEANVLGVNAFDYCDVKLDSNLILNMKIKLARKEGVLQHFVGEEIDIHSFVEPIMDALTYKQILNKDPVTVMSSSVPDKLKCYIPRSVLLYCKLNQNAFAELTDAIFLFEGLEQFQVTQIALHTKELRQTTNVLLTDVSSNQLNATSVHFILLLHSSHFDTIAGNTQRSVYWVQYFEDEYYLVKSAGLNAVTRIRPHMESVKFSEEEFATKYTAQHTGKHAILCDSPGMGKSILLEQIARRLELITQENLVLMVHSSKLANIRSINKQSPCAMEIFSILSAEFTKNEFGKKLLSKVFYKNLITVHLLLDAFDELDENQKESWLKNLHVLLREWSCFRVIVTSRLHGLSYLENLFGSLRHQILPFQESDQIAFFLKYWKEKHAIVETNNVRNFALGCLQTRNRKASPHELKITGIPLQCRMLAELYADEALTVLENPAYISTFSCRTDGLVSLYTNYINKALSEVKDEQEYLNYHIYKALILLFPQKKHEQVYNSKFSFCEQTVYRIGIMEKDSIGQEQFVHRTFAEFLVAKYWSDLFHTGRGVKNAGDIKQFVALTNTMFEFKDINQYNLFVLVRLYPILSRAVQKSLRPKQTRFVHNTIIFFLNEHFRIAEKGLCIAENILEHFSAFEYFEPFITSKWVVACVLEKFEEIIMVISSMVTKGSKVCENTFKKVLNQLDNEGVSHMDLIINSALCSSGKTFKTIWEMATCDNVYYESRSIVVHVAVLAGNYEVFEYLLNCYKYEILNQVNILWTCIRVTRFCSIEGKLQILKLLLKEAPELISESVFREFSSNFALIRELIVSGANLETKTKENYSIAHTATYYCSADEYHELVCLLVERRKQFLFREKSHCRIMLTPLHLAICKGITVKPATLELLVKECNVSFHNFTLYGETELYEIIDRALLSNVWKNILIVLIGLGVNISDYCRHNDRYAHTPLSMAVNAKHESILKLLLDGGANVNNPKWIYNIEENPYTLLELAMEAGNDSIINMLLDANIDVNDHSRTHKYCYPPLAYALSMGNETLVKRLLEAGADVNVSLCNGSSTPLSLALVKFSKIPDHVVGVQRK